MGSLSFLTVRCGVDGGAGALAMSVLSPTSALWKGGGGSADRFSSSGGMRSWY